MVAFTVSVRNFFVKNNFEAVLAAPCSYDYSIKTSEEVEKITTNQKDCHKCYMCVTVCCIAKAYHQ